MSFPEPKAGLVIRYSYLWHREHSKGKEEGLKDRPCAIILAVAGNENRQKVMVLPVTHTPPQSGDVAIELPSQTKSRLGLDGERSWIVISESNEFLWPGPDLRSLPGSKPARYEFGMLPPNVFNVVRDRFVTLNKQRQAKRVPRTE